MTNDSFAEIPRQLEQLATCRAPYLLGLRHHSAAICRIIDPLLRELKPACILLEMPTDFAAWLDFLTDEQTTAPIAISAADPQGNLAFYPLADFSPELVILRWAKRHRVPLIPFDLSAGAQVLPSKQAHIDQILDSLLQSQNTCARDAGEPDSSLLEQMLAQTCSADTGQLWERLIETPGLHGDAEAVRRAALLFGWAVRKSHTASTIPAREQFSSTKRDLIRECAMREALRKAPPGSVACVGAFHAGALLPSVVECSRDWDREVLACLEHDSQSVGVSLIPYSFQQFDERSGYPAGIRDPIWHDRMVAAATPQAVDQITTELVVDICRLLRSRGFVAGTPDATEILRMMRDLAKLRGLPAAGRGEFIEAIQSCLVQGELHSRGRAVAQAMEQVLIGEREGKVTPHTPRCGLAQHLDDQLAFLKLPTSEIKELRLDPLRDPRDRARAVVLRQLAIANIPYAKRIDSREQGDRENLIEVWEAGFRQGTFATIAALSRFGATLPQAVEGILQLRLPKSHSDEWNPKLLLELLVMASECGLHSLTRRAIGQLTGSFLQSAHLTELVRAASWIRRILAGQVPGLPLSAEEAFVPILFAFQDSNCDACLPVLFRASLDRLTGILGSNDPNDVVGLAELGHSLRGSVPTMNSTGSDQANAQLFEQGLTQLVSWCFRAIEQGSPRMCGAAIGLLCLLDLGNLSQLEALLQGWTDDAIDPASRQRLKESLAGTVQLLLPKLQTEAQWLHGLSLTLQNLDDAPFLKRLPPLRGAFQEFSPADRKRILDVQLETLEERGTRLSLGNLADDIDADLTTVLANLRIADLSAQAVVTEMLFSLRLCLPEDESRPSQEEVPAGSSPQADPVPLMTRPIGDDKHIGLADRWRMILGFPPQSEPGFQAARALDQLYGRGKGEGARTSLTAGGRGRFGGTEDPAPSIAQWAADLEAIFGSGICQEVLGKAAASGNLNAIQALDPDSVIPSTELLQQVLSLAGTTSPAKTEHLRKLARKIIDQLARQLTVRTRPHVHGLSISRPTRRKGRRLSLSRTLRSNLVNTIRRADGRRSMVAKDLVFQSAAKREMDWHLTFVVDVSGSMSESVVFSALCAAIFSRLPALTVRFLAFSTRVIDLSDQVHDPLSLLLEVQVGGGTHIGLGLRHARGGLRVPSRSLVVLVTDFEEGVSPGEMVAEVRALVESGVKCIGLAALDDSGVARFHQGCAAMVANAGMPVAAVGPEKLAQWVGDQIRNK